MLRRGFGLVSRIRQVLRSNQRLLGISANPNALFQSRASSGSTKLMSLDLVHSVLREQGAEDICCIKVPEVGFLISDWSINYPWSIQSENIKKTVRGTQILWIFHCMYGSYRSTPTIGSTQFGCRIWTMYRSKVYTWGSKERNEIGQLDLRWYGDHNCPYNE